MEITVLLGKKHKLLLAFWGLLLVFFMARCLLLICVYSMDSLLFCGTVSKQYAAVGSVILKSKYSLSELVSLCIIYSALANCEAGKELSKALKSYSEICPCPLKTEGKLHCSEDSGGEPPTIVVKPKKGDWRVAHPHQRCSAIDYVCALTCCNYLILFSEFV